MTANALFRHCLPTIAAGAVLATSLLATENARATAIADASAWAQLTVTGITADTGGDPNQPTIDLFESLGDINDAFSIGNASATSTTTAMPTVDFGGSPVPLAVDDTVTLSSVAGASADPAGTADALAGTVLYIDLFNDSQGTFTIDFSLEWSAAASASVDDAAHEDAFSSAVVEVFNDSFSVDELFEFDADALFGPPSGSGGNTLPFSITLAPQMGDSLFVFADATALAFAEESAPVPAPATALLIGAGLLMMAARRRGARRQGRTRIPAASRLRGGR